MTTEERLLAEPIEPAEDVAPGEVQTDPSGS